MPMILSFMNRPKSIAGGEGNGMKLDALRSPGGNDDREVTMEEWKAGGRNVYFHPAINTISLDAEKLVDMVGCSDDSSNSMTQRQRRKTRKSIQAVYERVRLHPLRLPVGDKIRWCTFLPGLTSSRGSSYAFAQMDAVLKKEYDAHPASTTTPRLYLEFPSSVFLSSHHQSSYDWQCMVWAAADFVEAQWTAHNVRRTILIATDDSSRVVYELLRRRQEYANNIAGINNSNKSPTRKSKKTLTSIEHIMFVNARIFPEANHNDNSMRGRRSRSFVRSREVSCQSSASAPSPPDSVISLFGKRRRSLSPHRHLHKQQLQPQRPRWMNAFSSTASTASAPVSGTKLFFHSTGSLHNNHNEATKVSSLLSSVTTEDPVSWHDMIHEWCIPRRMCLSFLWSRTGPYRGDDDWGHRQYLQACAHKWGMDDDEDDDDEEEEQLHEVRQARPKRQETEANKNGSSRSSCTFGSDDGNAVDPLAAAAPSTAADASNSSDAAASSLVHVECIPSGTLLGSSECATDLAERIVAFTMLPLSAFA